MDTYAAALVRKIVSSVEADDSREGYARACGMRDALEMYLGRDEARRVLAAAGHEY